MKNSRNGSQNQAVLSLRDLSVTLHREGQANQVLRGVDLDVFPGEIVALVGESGSGKSTLGLAVLGLLPDESQPRVAGSIRVTGTEVVGSTPEIIRKLRRENLGAIFQDPMTSLNPSMSIGKQLVENITDDTSPAEWLARVGIENPESRLRSYPNQLSGGQRQRVMIAIAMASSPDLVIADEPTTALDVTVQAQILHLIRHLCKTEKTAFVFITHDLSVAAAIADRIVVLYAGCVLELGPIGGLMANPAHPYTAALLKARFDLHADKSRQLSTLAGLPPAPGEMPPGCPFQPRCLMAVEACSQALPSLSPVAQHSGAAACIRASEVAPDIWNGARQQWQSGWSRGDRVLLKMSGIEKSFKIRRSMFGQPQIVHAAQAVELALLEGECVALVGESGSGKSTLLRLIAGLLDADQGEIDLCTPDRPQMIFQEAAASLTPWLRVDELVGERLRSLGVSRAERKERVLAALDLVGLSAELASSTASQLSIGQCQRVAIARAIVVPPTLLLCDEPVSAMDVSLAAGILNLLISLQRKLDMTMLFVTHDLAAARYVADRIIVMQEGRVLEVGLADDIVRAPEHPYTRDLLASVPDNLAGVLK